MSLPSIRVISHKEKGWMGMLFGVTGEHYINIDPLPSSQSKKLCRTCVKYPMHAGKYRLGHELCLFV